MMAYPGGAPVTIVGGSTGNQSGGSAGTLANPIVTSTGATTKADRSIVASTTSQQAAAANTARKRLVIKNLDAAINVFVNLGAAANATFAAGAGSMRVEPGATLTLDGTTQALNVVAASGTPNVAIWEF